MERVVFIPGCATGLDSTEAAHRGLEATRAELAVTSEREAEVAT